MGFLQDIEIKKQNNIKYVDAAVSQDSMNKFEMWEKLKFDVMFVGYNSGGTSFYHDFQKKPQPSVIPAQAGIHTI